MKGGVGASQSGKTYRPSGRAGADPFALTDAAILAGASRLAFPETRLLAAGERDGDDVA